MKKKAPKESDFDQMDKINYFFENEIKALLKVIKAPDDKLLFQLGIELGARVNEMAELKWTDLDWRNQFIRIWDEKKDRERLCTVPKYIWLLLKKAQGRRMKLIVKLKTELKACRKSTKAGRHKARMLKGRLADYEHRIFPMSYKTINRKVKAWAKEAGIIRIDEDGKDMIRWHMLRHTYVIQSRRRGRDWGFLAQQTGNAVGNLIASYGKLSMEDRIEITNQTQIITGKMRNPSSSNDGYGN